MDMGMMTFLFEQTPNLRNEHKRLVKRDLNPLYKNSQNEINIK
jgi:hypothetical protein